MMQSRHYLRRLLIAALVLLASIGAPGSFGATPVSAATNPVQVENLLPGTAAWKITGNAVSDAVGQIQGYASATSVNKGEAISFHVTVNPPQPYSIDIFRLGHYQGLGARLMQQVGPLSGTTQPACPLDATTGLIECAWAPAYSLTVPTDWTSGVFLALLTNASDFQSYIMFVVRDDGRVADLLYQQPVNRYQAYNGYPNNGVTGKSLYEENSYGANTVSGTRRAVKVSFDRPYTNWDGAGDFFEWEIYYVRWLEQAGYDVSYSTNIDTHANPERLLQYKGFLSVGHDEYWSKEMFDGAIAARDAGRSLGFFGANQVYWQIRMESSAQNAPNRVMVCYKSSTLDPVQGPTTTGHFRNPPVNRPEQFLLGSQFGAQQPDNVAGVPYVVTNSQHWVYAGTGLANGSTIPGIVGYEADRFMAEFPAPDAAPGSPTLLSSSPFQTFSGTQAIQNSTIYQSLSGSWVFNAGSIYWSWGLSNDENKSLADTRLQRITANILDRFINPDVNMPARPTNLAAALNGTDTIALSWADNATNETSYVLERSTSIGFSPLTTVALPANSTSYVDSGLSPGTYYYRVWALNGGSSSVVSNIAGASLVPYQALVLNQSGLLSYWRLGEASGTTALDSKGTNNGSYQNGVSLGAAGALTNDSDSAASFSSGTVNLPALAAVSDFTIEGWTNLDSGLAIT